MSWNVEVKYTPAGSWVDITSSVLTESLKRKWVLWNNLKAVGNTLEFRMHRNATVITNLLQNDDVEIRVTKDSLDYFTGLVRHNFRIETNQTIQPVRVECVDYSERLRKQMDWTGALKNYKVCDPADTSASLVHYLLTQEGSGIVLDVPTISTVVPLYVNIGGKDKTTYWRALDALLYQFGYVWDFNPSGEFTLYNVFPSSTSTLNAFSPSNTRDKLRIEKKLEDYDGVEVTWWTQATDAGVTAFKDTTGGNATNEMNVLLAPGDVYPGDDTRPFYAEYDYGKGEVLSVDNATLSYAPTSGMTTNTFTNAFRRALVQIENTSGSNITLTRFRITGDVTYRGDTNIVRSEDWSTSMKRLSVEAPLLQDMGQAQALATGLKRYYQYSDFRYTLKSSDEFEPGDFIDVEDTNLGIDHRCVIIEQRVIDETTDNTIYEYVLEAIEEFVAETTAEESEHGPANDINEQIDNLPATSTIIDLIDDGYINSGSATNPGTTVPAVPVVTASPAVKAVAVEWDYQSNLTNFEKHQVQVSNDAGSTWYSLDFDGIGIGTINEMTDWYSTLLLHMPLPLGGTADDPLDSTWHYRVRRVTKSGANSDWSTSVSANAKPVGAGDLAEDSIYANNIRANAVVADKIAAGSVSAVKMSADNFLFTKAVGSINRSTPASGDVRSYLGKDPAGAQADADPVGISIEEYNGENYETRFKAAMRSGGGVADAFVSGFFQAGESVLSSPGLIWTERDQPFTTSGIQGITYGNDVFVSVGEGGKIARSTDGGITWGSLISNPLSATTIYRVAYGDNVFIATGSGGRIARSTDDGITWGSLISNPMGTSGVFGVAYGNDVWVIMAANGKIARSTDGGITWGSLISNPFGTSNLYGIAYGNGVWVAGGSDGKIARSTDGGITWGSLISNPFGTSIILGIAYSDGVWIAVGEDGKIARSTDDGITWGSLISNPFGTSDIWALSNGNGVWVSGSRDGKVARSTDGGLTWGPNVYGKAEVSQPFATDGYFRSVVAVDGRFVIVGYLDSDSSGIIATSDWLEAGAGIVEQGSNANGEYVVFSSGLQVCQILKTVTDQTIDNAYGTLYQNTRLWTYPKPFATEPAVLCSLGRWGTGASWANTGNLPGVTTCLLRFYDILSRGSGTTFHFSAYAIGVAG